MNMIMVKKNLFMPEFEHMNLSAGDGRSATSAILPGNKSCQNLWFIYIMGKLPLPSPALREQGIWEKFLWKLDTYKTSF